MGVRGIMFQEVFGPAAAQRAESMAQLRRDVEALRPLETDLVRLGVSPHAAVHRARGLADRCGGVRDRRRTAGRDPSRRERRRDRVSPRGRGAVRGWAAGARDPGRAAVAFARPSARGAGGGARPAAADPLRQTRRIGRGLHRAATGVRSRTVPPSNAVLGHGIAPVRELLDAGAVVGLGSDSAASNDQMDMLGEARLASLMQSARLQTSRRAVHGGGAGAGDDGRCPGAGTGREGGIDSRWARRRISRPFHSTRCVPRCSGPEAAALAVAGTPASAGDGGGAAHESGTARCWGSTRMLASRVSESAAALVAWRHGLPAR